MALLADARNWTHARASVAFRCSEPYAAGRFTEESHRLGRCWRMHTNIPPKANRKRKNCFSPFLYRNRNAIERMFCRLKDFRRFTTRYDRSATNFLAAVYIAATISYWL